MPGDYGLAAAEWSRDRMEPPEPNPVLYCDKCGDGIYEGDAYYKIDGNNVCDNCLENYRRTA